MTIDLTVVDQKPWKSINGVEARVNTLRSGLMYVTFHIEGERHLYDLDLSPDEKQRLVREAHFELTKPVPIPGTRLYSSKAGTDLGDGFV